VLNPTDLNNLLKKINQSTNLSEFEKQQISEHFSMKNAGEHFVFDKMYSIVQESALSAFSLIKALNASIVVLGISLLVYTMIYSWFQENAGWMNLITAGAGLGILSLTFMSKPIQSIQRAALTIQSIFLVLRYVEYSSEPIRNHLYYLEKTTERIIWDEKIHLDKKLSYMDTLYQMYEKYNLNMQNASKIFINQITSNTNQQGGGIDKSLLEKILSEINQKS
jgi:hypothetical protein